MKREREREKNEIVHTCATELHALDYLKCLYIFIFIVKLFIFKQQSYYVEFHEYKSYIVTFNKINCHSSYTQKIIITELSSILKYYYVILRIHINKIDLKLRDVGF